MSFLRPTWTELQFSAVFCVDKISSVTFVRLVSAINVVQCFDAVLTMATVRLKKDADEQLKF
jgi:hypothetical protein